MAGQQPCVSRSRLSGVDDPDGKQFHEASFTGKAWQRFVRTAIAAHVLNGIAECAPCRRCAVAMAPASTAAAAHRGRRSDSRPAGRRSAFEMPSAATRIGFAGIQASARSVPACAAHRSGPANPPPYPGRSSSARCTLVCSRLTNTRQFATIVGHAQALAQRLHQRDAAVFVGDMAWPFGRWRLCPCPDRDTARQSGYPAASPARRCNPAPSSHAHRYRFRGGAFRRLRYAPEHVQFGQQPRQRAAIAQHRAT